MTGLEDGCDRQVKLRGYPFVDLNVGSDLGLDLGWTNYNFRYRLTNQMKDDCITEI